MRQATQTAHIALPDLLIQLIARLQAQGFQAFVIGGCVRDSLLGIKPKDWDIATSATPRQITTLFSEYRLITLGARFGTIGLLPKPSAQALERESRERESLQNPTQDSKQDSAQYIRRDAAHSPEQDSEQTSTPKQDSTLDSPRNAHIRIELTTFRLESCYTDKRRPSAVAYTEDFLQDIARRDFTCNALGYNPYLAESSWHTKPHLHALYGRYAPFLRGGICDYAGGLSDITSKILRCVGDAQRTFCDDALRILRGLRFHAQLPFSLESHTKLALIRNAPHLHAISAERKQEEWSKILYAPHSLRAIAGFGEVWAVVFAPFAKEVRALCARLATRELPPRLLRPLLALESLNTPQVPQEDSGLSLRLGLWFYALFLVSEGDLSEGGKMSKTSKMSGGTRTLGARLQQFLSQVESSLEALRYKSSITKLCISLLSHAQLSPAQSLESTRILACRLGLERASLVGSFLTRIHGEPSSIDEHIAQIQAQSLCYNLHSLALNGRDVQQLASSLGLALEGRRVGAILQALLQAVIASELANTREALSRRARDLLENLG